SRRTFAKNRRSECLGNCQRPKAPDLEPTVLVHLASTSHAPLPSGRASPVKQFKNVTLAESSCNLKMLPVAVGAVGMWESGVWFLAGFPSAEGSVGNSSWLLEFSTLSSARHFHSAWPAVFSRIGTRRPAVAR